MHKPTLLLAAVGVMVCVSNSVAGCASSPTSRDAVDRCFRRAATVVYYYPAQLEAVRERVIAAGYAAGPIEETFYEMSEFRVQDPDGNEIWIGASNHEAI